MLNLPSLARRNVQVAIKREDLLDPYLGGNKFYKLFYHLRTARSQGLTSVLSFGGAYSNHLYALAAAGRTTGLRTLGVVRGERPKRLSATLQDVQRLGMQLVFLSRSDYRRKQDPEVLAALRRQLGEFYLVPEGGGDELGAKGCQTWAEVAIENSPFQPTLLCAAAGTGATMAGLMAARQRIPVLGVLALKGRAGEIEAFRARVQQLAASVATAPASLPNLLLASEFHCGGYAKYPEYLRSYVEEFEAATGVPLDPVYTAKLAWAIERLTDEGTIAAGSRLLMFHTGGLQGRRGFCSGP